MITLEEFMLFWLGLMLGIQLIYVLIIFGRLAFYKQESKGNLELPPVSVIVAAKNEYENLQKLIPALLSQDYPEFEIVIVDDKSTDDSFMYLYDLKDKEPKIKHCRIDETPDYITSKKFAITIGVRGAKYEHLLFTDADCLPVSNQWIREMAGNYMTGDYDFVLGVSQYEKMKGFLNKFIRFETFLVAVQYLSFAIWKRPYMGLGRNISYKRDAFLKNKGFLRHQHIVGGDDDLLVNEAAKGKKTAVAILRDAQTISVPKQTWKDWYYQKLRHLSVGKFYKGLDKFLLGIFHLTHIGFYLLLILSYVAKVPYEWILGAYGIRLISLLTVFQLIKHKIDENFELYLVPFMDIIYIFYYIFVGVIARTTKQITWRK